VLAGAGCGDASLLEAPSRVGQSRATLSGGPPTCVSFQRGGAGLVADAKISNKQPGKNFGNDPVAALSSSNGHVEQVLLRFDLHAIPPYAQVSSAVLTVWQTQPGRPTSLHAHAVTSSWAEGSVTWDSFGAAFDANVATSVETPAHDSARSLEVSGLVAGWLESPASNQGLLLTQGEGKTIIATSESPHAQRRPRLEVCYTELEGTPPSGTSVLLEVLDTSGNPVPTAVISTQQAVFPTDGVGRRLFEALPPGRFAAKVEARGYTSATAVVELTEGAHLGHQVRLKPLGEPIPFQAEAGAVIATPGVRVEIPPAAVVDALGRPVSGPVEVTVVPLDPSTQLEAMPGPLEGTLDDGRGTQVQLETLFMAEVSLWRQGAPVQLKPGARATLRFELPDASADQLQVGDTVPAWWFDLEAGQWREQGAGTIEPSLTRPGKLAWVVEVSHFTWWNSDKPWTDKSCVQVQVLDTQGRPVPATSVNAAGVDYMGNSSGRTGPDGRTCVEIKRASTARLFVGPESAELSNVVTVTGSADAAACGMGPCGQVLLTMTQDIICTPGAYELCPYPGPEETLDVGQWRAGARGRAALRRLWHRLERLRRTGAACHGVVPLPVRRGLRRGGERGLHVYGYRGAELLLRPRWHATHGAVSRRRGGV
jgi:hypothetical protein